MPATHSAGFCVVREENGNALPGGPHPPIPSGCTATLGHLKRDQISLIDQDPNLRKEKLVVVTRLLGRGRGIAAKDRAGLPVTELGTEEREHGRVELFVKGGAVKARRIGADLGYGLRQCGRRGHQKGEVP